MSHVEVGLASTDLTATRTLLEAGLAADRISEHEYLTGTVRISLQQATQEHPSGLRYLAVHGPAMQSASQQLAAAYPRREIGDGYECCVEGVLLRLGATADPAPSNTGSGNVRGIDHLGVAADATEALTSALCSAVGFRPESRQIDTQMSVPLEVFSSDHYGVVSRSGQPRPAGALLVTFLRYAGTDVEILEDIMATGDVSRDGPGSTTGDNRAIANFVARRGPGLHHLAMRVESMAEGIAAVKACGVRMIDDHGRPGSRGGHIAFADRRSTGGIVVHLVQREEPGND